MHRTRIFIQVVVFLQKEMRNISLPVLIITSLTYFPGDIAAVALPLLKHHCVTLCPRWRVVTAFTHCTSLVEVGLSPDVWPCGGFVEVGHTWHV